MSINTALSGLRSAQSQLDVISNNIANASTTGFKKSRAEFADVYSSSVFFSGADKIGSGSTLASVTQQFDQGTLNYTNNSLDLGLSGKGMFITKLGDNTSYTRSGAMQLDDDGFIVSNQGANLMGYLADADGNVRAELTKLQITSGEQPPSATSTLTQSLNLNSESDITSTTVFDTQNEDSFNFLTTAAVYDSLGRDYTVQQYFVKESDNSWRMYPEIDGTPALGGSGYLTVSFNTDGTLANFTVPGGTTGAVDGTAGDGKIQISPPASISAGADQLQFDIDITGISQFGTDFSVTELSQDGYTAGRLAGLDIGDNGDILARYSNGRSQILGRIAVADFTNLQGLSPAGDSGWIETSESGQPIIGQPGTGTLGLIQAGALEESNVDTSEELVALITAQRNYQANAKVIETAETVTQAILNLR